MSSYQKSVSLDAVIVDQRVQRTEGPDQRRVDKMASMFNPDALGVLILSEREDGTLVCLDGMHRCLSARKAGHTALMESKVFTGLTLPEEASLFLLYNDKKDPSAVSKFNARVVAGDPVAQEIDRIVRSHGWKVSVSTHPGCINAINKAENVYRTGAGSVANGEHPDILDRVLSIITAAWGYDQHGVHQAMLAGVAQVIGTVRHDGRLGQNGCRNWWNSTRVDHHQCTINGERPKNFCIGRTGEGPRGDVQQQAPQKQAPDLGVAALMRLLHAMPTAPSPGHER